jgi:hypothetical protein
MRGHNDVGVDEKEYAGRSEGSASVTCGSRPHSLLIQYTTDPRYLFGYPPGSIGFPVGYDNKFIWGRVALEQRFEALLKCTATMVNRHNDGDSQHE